MALLSEERESIERKREREHDQNFDELRKKKEKRTNQSIAREEQMHVYFFKSFFLSLLKKGERKKR